MLRCYWILLSCFPILLVAQELPPIENFTPIDYGAENQNWGITQSQQKTLYVANNGGLLEFNGAIWKLYGSPNGSTIRSVKAINNVVYTGCYMEFGFWRKNSIGDLVYNSLSSKLSIPLKEDEEFWNILQFEEWVLFQSLERIYIYNTLDESVKFLNTPSTKAHMFGFDGTIYYHTKGHGLFRIENGESVLVSGDPIVKNQVVSGIFSLNEKSLLVTEKGEFYFFDDNNLSSWNSAFNDEVGSINVYSSLQLSDKSIVLGTISNGIYHIDPQGNIIQKINQEKGLNNNTVLSIFEDGEKNLWLALDNGISVINVDSPFKEYIDKNGRLGVVYASTIYENRLYLGTNQGLFTKPNNSDGDFKLVEGTEGQVWVLNVIENTLFCGHNNGTYRIQNGKADLVSNFPGTWDLKPVQGQENLILQGSYNGLSLLAKVNGRWQFRNVIEGFDISSRFFEFIGKNRIAVNHEFKGIFKLELDDLYYKVVTIEKETSKGIGASLTRFSDEVLYTCEKGVFKYDAVKKQFVEDSLLTDLFHDDADDPIGIFISDKTKNRLWTFTETAIVYATPGKFSASPEINKVAIPSYVRKNLGVLGFESLTPLGDERYLVGISNGYLTVDLKKLVSKKNAIFINSISRKSNDSEYQKISKDSVTKFEYSQNNLFFSYHVPEFDKYTEVNYQYQLEGIYDNWSELANTASVSFDNLPFGNYVFNVRAKVGKDFSSNVASYRFRIERPWYLSNLAIFLYVLTFVLSAVLIHKFYKGYYRKQRERLLSDNKRKLKRKKLKAQKKIVQIKNEKLREEVESKNRELAISTMSIIKKNEFLNAIKDQLKNDAQNPQVKSVIRTIDRNINNSDDWKFFEDAFNNADKDFLKKVKNFHPELTANDLRLCAYLRLNLSSKEIAPLLNISVRSVEVKRYRLRKKINLAHESGLVDYIMQI